MQVCILGPLEIRCGTERMAPARRRASTLLGLLALRANTPVSTDWIIDALWAGRPPRSAAVNLRSYVADVRRVLADPAGPRVESGRGSYRLAVRPDELDLLVFEALAEEGRRHLAAGRHELAAERLTRAYGLWRGQVLEGLPLPDGARPAVQAIQDRQVDVIEDCVEARLALGQHAQLAAELRTLTGQHELRERLWGQLMLALYRCERQGEAIEAYRRLYRLLHDELGVEPSRQLQELHLRILRVDPGLGLAPAGPVPRQLPPEGGLFVGRAAELDALDAVPAVAVVSGTAGVGKTALAVRWAHRAAGRFPGGCLYADLRGYSADPPLPPAEVLARFLRSLGVPPADLPAEQDELSALYRTLLAGRRALVVLDNARSGEQIRPLLPGSPSCAVLVTSRDDLAGLVARDGAHRIELDLLAMDEAVGLLRRLVGPRVDADPAAAAALAERCARLPLALRVAAELAVSRPGVPLADLLAESNLAESNLAANDLAALDADGDPRTAVRAVFGWSYRALGPELARALRLLGQCPGRDVDGDAVVALTGNRRLMDGLVRAHLVMRTGPDRYGMHDLLRAYAAGLPDLDGEYRAALSRLFDHYLDAATAATDAAFRPNPAPDTDRARAWLDTERRTLVAVAVHCGRHGWPEHVAGLSRALWPYLDAGAHHRDALAVHESAYRAAQAAGDRAGEGAAAGRLGVYHFRIGRYREAFEHHGRALAIRQETGDVAGQAKSLNATASMHLRLGNYPDAVEQYQRALVLCRQVGAVEVAGAVLSNLPLAHYRLGRYAEALDHVRLALRMSRDFGDAAVEGWASGITGLIHARLGHYPLALRYTMRALNILRHLGHRDSVALALTILGAVYTQLSRPADADASLAEALAIFAEIGDRAGEADARSALGRLRQRQGRYAEALDCHERALAADREIGERFQEAAALNDLAGVLHALGRAGEADGRYRAALALAMDTGNRYEHARAQDGLAALRRDAGQTRQALDLWRAALATYTDLGVPEADEVRVQALNPPAAS